MARSIRSFITASGLGAAIIAVFLHNAAPSSPRAAYAQSAPRAGKPAASTAAPLTNLNQIDPLKGRFQRDAGKVRLITLLSPT